MTTITTKEAAEILGVTPGTVVTRISQGDLIAEKVDHIWKINKGSVLRLKRKREKPAKRKYNNGFVQAVNTHVPKRVQEANEELWRRRFDEFRERWERGESAPVYLEAGE